MKKRIFWSILALALLFEVLALALCLSYIASRTRSALYARLEAEAHYLAQGLEREGLGYLERLSPGQARISLIAQGGQVLFDSQADKAEDLENHASRPEVLAARARGFGRAERESASLGLATTYSAHLLSDGNVLRLAATGETALGALLRLAPGILAIFFLAFLLCAWLAARIAQALVAPLNSIDPNAPEKSLAPAEIAPLLAKLKAQKAQISAQLAAMGAQKAAFEAVAENMAEGLILLDPARRVLMANIAAARLLDLPDLPLGSRLLALARAPELAKLLDSAQVLAERPGPTAGAQGAAGASGREASAVGVFGRGASVRGASGPGTFSRGSFSKPADLAEILLRLNGRWIEIHASAAPLSQAAGKLAGYVLIIQDVTEKEEREALRREFSANVSHELKTPLTSILGRAELLAQGMVAHQDLACFARDMYKESQRLLAMIANLLKLSQLENAPFEHEAKASDLALAARMALSRLEEMAGRRGIGLATELESCQVFCDAALLEEMVFNILENALKYTPRGGSVRLCTRAGKSAATGACLEISDNGRGIAREVQGRVFERFFRISQASQSAAEGQRGEYSPPGHGLGLSIVKHIADSCQARLELTSTPGQGTCVRVFFPPSTALSTESPAIAAKP